MTAGQKKRTYRYLFLIVFISSFGFALVHPFLPIYLQGLKLNGLKIGLIYAAYALAKVGTSPLVGKWSDQGNRRRFIRIGLELCVLVALGYLIIPGSFFILLILRVMEGIGISMVRPLALAFIGDISGDRTRGKLLGTFDLSFYAALSLGPVFGGILNDIYGFDSIFCCLSVLTGLALVVCFFFFPACQQKTVSKPSHKNIKSELPHNHLLIGLCIFIFTRAFGIIAMSVFMPLFLTNDLGFSHFQVGWIIGSGSVVTLFFLIPFGKLADRVNRTRLVFSGSIMTGISIVLISKSQVFWQIAVIYILMNLFSTLSLPASSALLAAEGSSRGMGLTFGIFNAVMNGGFLLAPVLGGLLMDYAGIKVVFLLAGGFGIAGGICFLLFSLLNNYVSTRSGFPDTQTSVISSKSQRNSILLSGVSSKSRELI